MKTTFITNFRYGGNIVKKVYLGKNLVWQCDSVSGEANSTSFAMASFNANILKELSGETDFATFDNVGAHLPEAVFTFGKSDLSYKIDSTLKLIETLLLYGTTKSKSGSDAISRVLESLNIGALSQSTSDGLSHGRVFISDGIQTNTIIKVWRTR